MENEKKICPMKFGKPNYIPQTCACDEEKCAWWCVWTKCCALVAIPVEIDDRISELRRTVER